MNRRTAFAAALAATAGLALAGCGGDSAPELKVSGAYMPQPVMKDMAGGFLVIKNNGDTADKLTSVTSDLSDDVTMHRTSGAKMEQVDSLAIPAHGELKLSRGGNHLMFMALKKKPENGDKVSVELHFGKAKPIKAVLPVKATNYDPQHAGHQ
ncbi:copper chaperone PCu(A)C [Streptomyces ochraceiscleroticus]|uniref:Copper chaperone PCu(A)C n=1 Tax=Streptomyces ochraceiscleroticus TaxID=47761 RepID=A0ABW1MNA9_9ACTN|nr:copper chaperone PCu(A)C [Streptomyces ochraceiscleroticus]